MKQNKQVDVGTMLDTIAQTMEQNKGRLDTVDDGPNGGTHGGRMVHAFRTAAQAARDARTDDAGQQLASAAEAMRRDGRGKAVGYYADGLQEAAHEMRGQQGISLDNVAPFLQSLVGGVQRNNPAQPGQGTMLDALLPAVTSMIASRGNGRSSQESLVEALGAAVTGARGTSASRGGMGGGLGGILGGSGGGMPDLGGLLGGGGGGGYTPGSRVDPGAASATNVLGGIVGALLPSVMGALAGGGGQGGQSGGMGGLGGLLGGGMGEPETQSQPTRRRVEPQDDNPFDQGQGGQGQGRDLGDLLDSIKSSGGEKEQGSSSGSWWPF